MVFPSPVLKRPIVITTPIPANSARPKRPTTAVDKERPKTAARPQSAFGLGSYSEEGKNLVFLLNVIKNNTGIGRIGPPLFTITERIQLLITGFSGMTTLISLTS